MHLIKFSLKSLSYNLRKTGYLYCVAGLLQVGLVLLAIEKHSKILFIYEKFHFFGLMIIVSLVLIALVSALVLLAGVRIISLTGSADKTTYFWQTKFQRRRQSSINTLLLIGIFADLCLVFLLLFIPEMEEDVLTFLIPAMGVRIAYANFLAYDLHSQIY